MPTRDGDFTKRAITEEGLQDAIKLLDGTEKAYRYSLESLANRIAALRQKEMQIRLHKALKEQAEHNDESTDSGWRRNYDPGSPDKLLDEPTTPKPHIIAELEAERVDLKESLRTTRLEQAAKAFQVDELETKVERLTAERNEAEEQVRTLTTERDTAKGHIKGWIEREARLSVEHMDELEQLQEQVERLTTEHEKDRQAWMSENTGLLTQVERLTEELREHNDDD